MTPHELTISATVEDSEIDYIEITATLKDGVSVSKTDASFLAVERAVAWWVKHHVWFADK